MPSTSSLTDLSPAHQRAMLAAAILRCDHLQKLRRGEVAPGPLDHEYACDPRSLDAAIALTEDNIDTLRAAAKKAA